MPGPIKDKHDDRKFRHFAKFNSDGTVAAVVEVAEDSQPPSDQSDSLYIDFTDLHPMDLTKVKVAKTHLDAIQNAKRAIKDALAAAKATPPDA